MYQNNIHDAPISLLRRIARISVVYTEASRIKLLHEYSPTIVGEPVYFLFAKYGSLAEIFFWNRSR
jgi:hypothetical protein